MTRYTAIDLFAGAGGLSLGLKASGIESQMAVEIMPDAAATYALHSPEVELCRCDIRGIDFKKWRGVDIVAGGPPCQPFSIGGLRRGSSDQRDLISEFVRAVLEARPRAFVMENVPGLASFGPYLLSALAPLLVLYKIAPPRIVNAADYGVPQSRRRLLVVGTRDGLEFELSPNGGRRAVAGDVLTPNPWGEPNRSKIVYAKRPDLRPNPYQGHLFNGGGRAVELDKPAPTILAAAGGNKTHFLDLSDQIPAYHRHLIAGGSPRSGELTGARRLTILESAALQSFPERVVFAGSRSSQYTQIGNAIPPKLGEAIGHQLIESFARSGRKRMAA